MPIHNVNFELDHKVPTYHASEWWSCMSVLGMPHGQVHIVNVHAQIN